MGKNLHNDQCIASKGLIGSPKLDHLVALVYICMQPLLEAFGLSPSLVIIYPHSKTYVRNGVKALHQNNT